jgi:predicted unusual protein kinase regulating ubiquinone biosynthesis (AarF/ABC1/UbiB family)
MQIRILGTLVNENNELVALDFGCMKAIPNDFMFLLWIDWQKVIDNKEVFGRNF